MTMATATGLAEAMTMATATGLAEAMTMATTAGLATATAKAMATTSQPSQWTRTGSSARK
jgi:3-hydroxyisobutyrate dehydrogenase-like beta-hydroxyacid dehydrogenase